MSAIYWIALIFLSAGALNNKTSITMKSEILIKKLVLIWSVDEIIICTTINYWGTKRIEYQLGLAVSQIQNIKYLSIYLNIKLTCMM